MTRVRGEIGREEAVRMRAVIAGDLPAEEDEQFMRRLRLRGGKLGTVIYTHRLIGDSHVGCVHIDNTPHDKAAAVRWQ